MSFIAQITADISNFDNNIKKAVDITNSSVSKMQSQFDKLGDSFVKIGAKASILSTAIIGATVGLVKMGIDAGNASAEINNLSTATSLSTDLIQELSYVATASNSSFEGLQSSMNSFQRRLKTVGEEGSKVNEMFGKLGVSTTDASGKVKSMDEVLLDTFNKLGDMENGLAKNAIGAELFGRSWNEVSLIVSSGSKGIEKLREEANKLGLVLDENTLKSSDNFATAMGLVGFQVDKIKSKIGAGFVPILQETVLPLLQDKIIPAVSKFADFIGQLSEKFNALSPSTKTAIFALGGIATAIGPVLLGLGGIIKILPLVMAGFTAITGPIGIAIAAITGGAILVIKNWDAIKAYFTTGGGSELFDSIKTLFNTVKDVVSDVFSEIKNTITTIWNAIGDTLIKVFGNSFDTIMIVITTAINIVSGVLNTFINLLKGDFSGALESIKTLAKDVFDGFKNIVFNSLSSMTAGLSKFFSLLKLNSLAETFADWSEKIKPSTEKIVEEIETVNEEIKETAIVTDTATQSITGLTEALDIFQSGKISEAIRTTSNEIKVLGDYLKDLRAGKIEIANVHDEIVKVEERISVLNTALNTLTGDRELNIKVKTDSALDIFKSTDFGKDAGLVIPILPTIDTSLLKDGIGDLKAGLTEVAIDVSGMLTDIIGGAFASLGDAIANGDNVLQSLGSSLLGSLGSIMIELGQMAIGIGLGLKSIKLALATLNPFVAIAVGGALIALGSMFASGSKKLSSSFGGSGGGGGYSSAPSMQSTGVSQSMPTGEFRDSYGSGQVEFTISGDNLVGVLNKKKHEETETYNEKAFEIEYKYKKVEIHIIDFVGDVRNINGTPDLFSLSYNSNINDKGQYILATEAEINIYEDAYFNIDELKTVGETDILIKYFEYDELVWQGFALPDFFQTGITKPRALRIVATDRLGVLKDIANTSVSNTPKEIIEECLLQTGLTLPLEIRNVDNYLTSTTIERERIEGISAYDIIRSFMVQFNSKIVQYKNKWWVVNKKLLEDGFSDQEVIDIDLVYLDGQREIKPTASEVSLYLEYGGSKRYPNNALFREWDGNKFLGWESKGGLTQRLNYKQIINYTKADGVSGYNANFGAEGSIPSLYCRYKMLSYNFENEGNYFNNQNGILSDSFPLRYRDGDTEVTLSIDFTTVSADIYLPFVIILKAPDEKFYAINDSGSVVPAYKETGGSYEVDLTKVSPIRVAPAEADYLDAVQSTFNETFIINQNSLGATPESSQIEFRVYSVGYRVPNVGSTLAYLDVLFNSIQVIFNKSDVTGKGLIFKTKQGGDKFSKVRETETTLFSDKINQGVNGYFYNYKYDDTSITNLPKEYLLGMTRQMADMFCSARDFYSFGGKFKVNPLARYRCGDKYFVFVGGVSHRETAEIDIEEIVSNSSLTRTDYIYTYFEDSKDNIKSIGTASGGGGAGGGSGGGGMTSSQLEMLTNLADWWKLDEENDAIYSEKSVYSLKGVSALGLGKGGGGGGGDGVDMLDSWANYTEAKADFYAPASLLVPFRNDTLSRLASLEAGGGGGGDIEISITGSGNAVTGVSLSENTLTFAKGSSFSLSTHNHDTLYKPIGYVPSWGEVTGKPTTFTPSAHTHTIANVTGLQGALDLKAPLASPTFTGNVTAPTFIGALIGNASSATKLQTSQWVVEQVGSELQFKYNGVIKQRMLSDGTILATGGITALSTE